ncbi:MAG: hypothetical protein ACYDHM_00180 [Acidiferrobacterales bacterium]
MNRNPNFPGTLARTLVCAFAVVLITIGSPSAFASGNSLKHVAKQVGHATGKAVHDIGYGAKKVGKEIGHDAKKVGKAIGAAARAGGRAFKHAVKGHKH